MRAAALCVLFAASNAAAATIAVPEGGNLQAAIDRARPGDVIELAAGAQFTGSFTLPAAADGDGFITIRTAGVAGGEGRIVPDDAKRFARLRSDGDPAIKTAPGAHHWRIEQVEIAGSGPGTLVALGDGSRAQNTLASVPHDIVLDRVYVHGDPATGVRRCIALNSADTTISRSYVADCKTVGEDAQAIAGWNGPGPFTITDNYLEGSTENVIFGGADPSIRDLVPSDITITGNVLSKPVEWRGQRWQVKNLLELKNARRVTIARNVLEYSWQAAQTGFAVLFTVRNQDGGCPWCQVEQVTFDSNLIRHAAGGIVILGTDNHGPSRQTAGIRITNNVFDDINPKAWGGNGYAFEISGGPRDVVIDHNTIVQENAGGVIQVDGPPIAGFVFTNNITRAGEYGIKGTNHGPGSDTIRAFFPSAKIAKNAFAEGASGDYPGGNLFPSLDELRKAFASFATHDYRLADGSRWRGAGLDGLDLGAAPDGAAGELDPRNAAADSHRAAPSTRR